MKSLPVGPSVVSLDSRDLFFFFFQNQEQLITGNERAGSQ